MEGISLRTSIIVLVSVLLAGAVQAQNWAFEDGEMGNWFVEGAEAEFSDEYSETGTYSLKISAADDTNEGWLKNQDDHPLMQAGHTIKYRIWVSEDDLDEINGINVYLHHSGWTWRDNWHGAEDLTADDWNTVQIQIPEDAESVEEFGFQINQHEVTGTPEIMVDWVYAEGMPDDILFSWNFETGESGNWFAENADGEVTDARYETGGYSFKVSSSDDSNEGWLKNQTDRYVLDAGQILSYRIWVSEDDLEEINGINVHLLHSGWDWHDNWHDAGDLTANDWNTVQIQIPEDAESVEEFGFQINQHDAAYTPEVYVDRITSEGLPEEEPVEELTVWDFEDQELGNWFEENSTLEITDARSETGTYSVEFTATDDHTEAWMRNETDFEYIEEGVIIQYRVWVSDDQLDMIHGLQPYLLDGEDGNWNATWYGAGDLTANEWNDVALELQFEPEDGIIESFGLQIVQHEAEDTPTLFVDYVSILEVPEEEEPEVEMIVIYERDFEDEEMGDWQVVEDAEDEYGGTAEISDQQSEEGTYSAKLTAADDQPNMLFNNPVVGDEVEEQDQISFRIWVSSDDLEQIDAIRPVFEHGILHQGWDYEHYGPEDLDADSWNTLTLEIPEVLNAMPHFVGLEILGSNISDTPVLYVDHIELARPDFPDPSDIVTRPDPGDLMYDFEEEEEGDLQGWNIDEGSDASNIGVTDVWSSYGDYALVADFDMDGESEAIVEVEFGESSDFSAYTHISAIAHHSADGDPDGMMAKLFVKTGDDWTWHDHEAIEFEMNEEEENGGHILLFELNGVEDLADVRALGVQFLSGSDASGTTQIYLDEIRSHPMELEEIDLPEGTDLLYSFEGGDLEGWSNEGDNVTSVATTDTWSSHGDYSQYTDIEFGSGTYHFRVSYGQDDPATFYDQYTHLSAMVRHDGEAPNYGDGGLEAHLYIMTDGWNWQDADATVVPVTSSEDGAKLVFDLANVDDLDVVFAMGVQFIENENAAGETRLYLDEVRGYYEDVSAEDPDKPGRFALNQNYPNPFNPVTTIEFEVPMQSHVTMEVYNVLGQRVMTLVDDDFDRGIHTVQFDGSNISSGVYLYRLEAGNFAETRKMLLIK